MTQLVLHLNDPASQIVQFEIDTEADELAMQVFQWLNADFSEHGSDVMTFNPTFGGTVVLHRSQVLYAMVGRVRLGKGVAVAEPMASGAPGSAAILPPPPDGVQPFTLPEPAPKVERPGFWSDVKASYRAGYDRKKAEIAAKKS